MLIAFLSPANKRSSCSSFRPVPSEKRCRWLRPWLPNRKGVSSIHSYYLASSLHMPSYEELNEFFISRSCDNVLCPPLHIYESGGFSWTMMRKSRYTSFQLAGRIEIEILKVSSWSCLACSSTCSYVHLRHFKDSASFGCITTQRQGPFAVE